MANFLDSIESDNPLAEAVREAYEALFPLTEAESQDPIAAKYPRQTEFIRTIAPIIKQCGSAHGFHVVSPIIAQACLETGYGSSAHAKAPIYNLFGMKCGADWKGSAVKSDTTEEFTKGETTRIKSKFRAYDSLQDGISGYFDFISAPRYASLKAACTPQEYLSALKECGYATDSDYVKKNLRIIQMFDLTRYDDCKA